MDIIEKMIKKGIYGKNNFVLNKLKLNKLIYPFILSKDRNNKMEFVKAIFEKEKENYNFTFDVHDNGENYLGRCCSNNHIDINIDNFDKLAIKNGNAYASSLLLIVLYHELHHSKQQDDYKLNLKNYRMSKEDYLITDLQKENTNNFYLKNHDFFEIEIDANINGVLNAYKLMNIFNNNAYNEIYENRMIDIISKRNDPRYYEIEKKFDEIISGYIYPFDLEYNFKGNRKSFEELLKNDIKDKQLYNHILLNKINEMKYIPKEGLDIVKQELIKLKQDIEFQKSINKDYSFLEKEIKKYKEYKAK